MAHKKWKEIKQQPSMLPVPAVPGSCLVSFHILWAILSTSTVQMMDWNAAGVMLSLRRSSLDGEMINDTFISGERESCESKKPPASLLAFFCQINLELLTEVLRRKNLAGGD